MPAFKPASMLATLNDGFAFLRRGGRAFDPAVDGSKVDFVEKLPLDLLVYLVQGIDDDATLRAMRETCKGLLNTVDAFEPRLASPIATQFVKGNAPMNDRLRLILSFARDLTLGAPSTVAGSYPAGTYGDVNELFKQTPGLRRLRLKEFIYSGRNFSDTNFRLLPNLEELVLEGCRLTPSAIESLTSGLPTLKRLRVLVRYEEEAPAELLSRIASFPRLQHLDLEESTQGGLAKRLNWLALPRSLRSLRIQCDGISAAQMAAIPLHHCPELETLEIAAGVPQFNNQARPRALAAIPLEAVPGLKKLTLLRFSFGDGQQIEFDARGVQLEPLGPVDALTTLLARAPNLETLRLPYCNMKEGFVRSIPAVRRIRNVDVTTSFSYR